MYFSITDCSLIYKDLKGCYIFGLYRYECFRCSCLYDNRFLDVLTAEEVGQMMGGN